MRNREEAAKAIGQREILARILRELRPHKVRVGLSLLCAVVVVVFTLMIPVLTGRAVDCIVGMDQVDFAALFWVLGQMALAVAVTFFGQWTMNRINNRITYEVTRDLRNRAFERLVRLPLKEIDGHSQGDYMSRIAADVDVLADGLLMGFTQLFTGVLTILGTIGFMFSINVPIALVVIFLTPASLFAAKFIAGKTYHMFRLQAVCRGEQTAFVEEMTEHQKLVKLFCYEDAAAKSFEALNERLSSSSLKATFFSSLTNPVTRFINSLVYTGVGVFGALSAISGGISVGGLASFLGYASQYTKPFNEISGVVTELQNAIACGGRIFEIIDSEPEEDAGTLMPKQVRGRVEFCDVSFSYDKSRPLIEHLSLTVEPGQRVAIVGPTGSGKTTLINLLMRFYELDGGKITVDGTDIRCLPREELRTQFGMVLQETWLKEGTIKENLKTADPKASDEEVVQAAKASHAHEFIKRLPEGYDTYIKSDGGSLSQGQKQLLCIARVMLDLPPMLILDEATSSIDTRTEMKIQEAFAKMMKGRTTFVVAHRLSTIKEADVILYMENGKVIEQGNHASLLRKNGAYAGLYRSQYME